METEELAFGALRDDEQLETVGKDKEEGTTSQLVNGVKVT